MPLSDSFKQHQPANLRLANMSTSPSADDLAFALSLAHKNPQNVVELPWRASDGSYYLLRVNANEAPEEPHWVLNLGAGANADVIWTYDSSDYKLLHSLMWQECEEKHQSKAPAGPSAMPEEVRPLIDYESTEGALDSVAASIANQLPPTVGSLFSFPASMSEPMITPVQSRSAENKAAESNNRSNGGDAAPQWSAPTGAPAPSGWLANAVPAQPAPSPAMQPEHVTDNFQSTFPAPPAVPSSVATVGALPPESPGGWTAQSGGGPQRSAPAHVPPAQEIQMPAAGQSSSPFASMPQAVSHQQQALAPAQDAPPPPAPDSVNLGPKPALSRRGFRLPGGPFNPQQAKPAQPAESESTAKPAPVPTSGPSATGWVVPPAPSPQPAWGGPPSPASEPALGRTPAAPAWTPPRQPPGWSPPPVLPPAQPQMPPAATGAEVPQPAGWSRPPEPAVVASPASIPGADVFMRVTADQSGAPRLSEPVPQQASPVAPVTMEHSESARANPTASQSNRPLPPPVDLDRAAVDSVWTELTNAETGLLNAAAFLFFMVNEVQRHSQSQHAFSVVRFDMCLEGSDGSLQPLPARAVREAARRIFNQMRPLALVGHYAGSDYAFLLPYASRAEAADFINSLMLSLTSLPLLPGDIENVSYFFGIASMPEDCTHPGVLLAAAQQALNAAKRQNRPIVTFAET